jgi:hypothetical protein
MATHQEDNKDGQMDGICYIYNRPLACSHTYLNFFYVHAEINNLSGENFHMCLSAHLHRYIIWLFVSTITNLSVMAFS